MPAQAPQKATRQKQAPPPPIQVATFDIETSNLNADFGIILCAVIKPSHSKKSIVFRGDRYPNWDKKRSNDSALVEDIAAELSKYSILIAHNGLRFDLPFIRTRQLRYGKAPMPEIKIIDPVLIARNKLRLSSNSLRRVTEHVGCGGKTEVHGHQWLEAALDGSRKAMNYIVEHCIADVEILETMARQISPYVKQINSWGSAI
jgi:uncharacterized protein YprB with RNaseH-like and TPR domain